MKHIPSFNNFLNENNEINESVFNVNKNATNLKPFGINNVFDSALKKLKFLIFSSSADISFNENEIDFLQQTVTDSNLTLFRGLGLIRQRVDDSNRKLINQVQAGEISPKFLNNSFHAHNVASFTKSQSVAKRYSEGEVSIVIKIEANKNQIICDLTNLEKLLKKYPDVNHTFDKEDFRYMKLEKEVIVKSNEILDSVIVYKKGYFRF